MRSQYALPRLALKALRATLDLGAARLELRRITPLDVVERNRRIGQQAAQSGHDRPAVDEPSACDEVAFFINRMAARVPWRSDCLVQALAGQRWLAREGIASEIVIGAAKRADGSLEAHAWLRHRARIVLGGDISAFQPLIDPDASLFDR